MWLKQSTTASCIVGPILDSTGAEYASAVIGDLSISKNGGTLTALASGATLTYISNGMYTLALTTGNTDTVGRVEISCNKSTYQMPQKNFLVLLASVFDALITNAANATGGLIAATAAVSAAAGYIGSTGAAVPVSSGKVAATIAAGDIATDAIDAASVKADAVTKIQTGLASQTSVDDLPTNAELATALSATDDAVLSAIAALNNITAADAAIAVRTNLATELARIDENISAAKTLTSAYEPAKTAATQTSVDDISDRLPAALTGDGNLKADALKVNGQTPQTIPTLAHFSVG